jgi:trimeric autotransporter adhesin
MRKFLLSMAVATLVVTSGCGGSSPGGGSTTQTKATLQSIQVTPATPSAAQGQNQQFTATGSYSDGSTQVLTASAIWSSSNTSIATIAAGGLATTKNPGATTITAQDSSTGISGTTMLTVTAVLVSISVSPANPSIAFGTSQQFTATGSYSDGSSQNLTATATWSSATTTVATISNSPGTQGVATGIVAGTSAIQATLGSIVGSANLTVTNAILQSISVTPPNPNFPLGTSQQFIATGSFSDGTAQVITSTVSWSSSSNSVMSIVQSGLATAKNIGSSTVTAISGSITGSTLATVNASNLSSISITTPYSTIAENTSVQFTATGVFTNGTTIDLTGKATWSSSQSSVATVSTGVAQGLAAGSTTISATLGSIGSSANLIVTNATVMSILVTPTGQTIRPQTTLRFTATGIFSDASSQDISQDVNWASDNTAVATIGNSSGGVGVATGIAAGTANISATLESVTGSVVLAVNSATLQSISLSPPTAVLGAGATLQIEATGSYSDGTTQHINGLLTWSSSAPGVASISSAGLATGQSAGPAIITASYLSLSSTANLVVESSAPSSISVTNNEPQVPVGIVSQFSATGTFPDGVQDLTYSVAWSSSPASVATISEASGSYGYATGVSPGTAVITALFGGVVGTGSLVVTSATLNSIVLSPSSASIAVGQSEQFSATGTFSDGMSLNLTYQVNWNSSNNNVAPVSDGLALGFASGSAIMSASLNGVTGTAALTVQ